MTALVTDGLRWWAVNTPESPAIVFDGHDTVSYRELDSWTDGAAHAPAARGIGRGDRVGMIGANSLEWCVAAIGALKLGAVVVPYNNRFVAAELSYLVDNSDPALVLADDRHRARMAEALVGGSVPLGGLAEFTGLRGGEHRSVPRPDAAPDDVAVLVYTSGTTSRPKGVGFTHRGTAAFITEWAFMEPALRQGAGPTPPCGWTTGSTSTRSWPPGNGRRSSGGCRWWRCTARRCRSRTTSWLPSCPTTRCSWCGSGTGPSRRSSTCAATEVPASSLRTPGPARCSPAATTAGVTGRTVRCGWCPARTPSARSEPPESVPIEKHVTIGYSFMPNMVLLRQPDHFQLLNFLPHPTDAQRCRMQTRLLIREPAETERQRAFWDKNWKILMDVLRDEDMTLNRDLQHALSSRDAESLVFGRNEIVNQWFHTWLTGALRDPPDFG
jgi:hypothetical protein